jgi:CxxC motif-containing protein (DUF1111 family)
MTASVRARFPFSSMAAMALLAAAAGGGATEERPRAIAEPDEQLSGGATTVFDATSHAYELAARNISRARRRLFVTGHAFFTDNWVEAPASTSGRDGLGPLFNAPSCSGCHPNDGRGTPDVLGDFEPRMGLVFRLSVPGPGGPEPHPVYGDQLQNRSIAGVPFEGQVALSTEPRMERFADGGSCHLHTPVYTFTDLHYGELGSGTLVSPRLAPAVFGLGLLAALPEAAILAHADPDDADGDGISGRPNWIPALGDQGRTLGRFGWKANVATLRQQISRAFLGDIGITTSLHPRENATDAQTAARAATSGGSPELDDQKLDRLELYMHLLAVPARRDWMDPGVRRGKLLFQQLQCAACHVPSMVTGELAGYPELSGQSIRPYTDLLLHDMGSELADGRPDQTATGTEWRTPPLWGLGLLNVVNGHTRLLHDGRARLPIEAIMWHGGEAAASRDAFRTLDKPDRDAVLKFLGSL